MTLLQKICSVSLGNKKNCFFNGKNDILDFYWRAHPRLNFLKTVPENANVLDVGASSGALVCWKKWNVPIRNDISFYANDLQKGSFFDDCKGYFVQDLSAAPLKDHDGFFQAILSSHVLEHVKDWQSFFDNIVSLLTPGGTMYLEWPTVESKDFPLRQEFLDKGIPVSTVNFHDDDTHLSTACLGEIQELLEERELVVTTKGLIRNTFLGEELLALGVKTKDSELCTYGVWMLLGFSQYLVLSSACPHGGNSLI